MMTIQQHQSIQKKIVVLIGPGFDEYEMVHFQYHLRKAGLAVCLVSHSAGLVTGAYGLAVRPDYSLDQLELDGSNFLLLLPGGGNSVTTLLADPRVHRLFERAGDGSGRVAITPAAAGEFRRTGFQALLTEPHFLRTGNGAGDNLLEQIINVGSDLHK